MRSLQKLSGSELSHSATGRRRHQRERARVQPSGELFSYNMKDIMVLSELEQFRQGAFGVVFFSRGRGRGHAVPDMAIERELKRAEPDLDIRFVSYSGGAHALRSCGYDVLDLLMPDDPPLSDAIVAQTRVVGYLRPRLVIAHEEFPALIAARVFEVPCIFITDFFQDPKSFCMEALNCAREIIFTAEPGIYTEPPFLRPQIHYVGPAVRRFQYGRADRQRARQELGIPAEAVLALCQPGNWPESQVPMGQVLVSALDAVPYPSKRLIWLAGRDYDALRSLFCDRSDITVVKEDWQIDRLFAASDLAITKANRQTVFEAASVGLPSISVSNGINWPDDVAVAHVRSNTSLHVRGLTADVLAQLMIRKITNGWVAKEVLPKWDGVSGAASLIAAQIERIRGGPRQDTASAQGVD
jgi:hypothetical protein